MTKTKEFTNNSAPFSDYRRYLRYSLIAEMIALLATWASTSFLPASLQWVTLGLAMLIILGVIGLFIWLFGNYRSLAVVREKDDLLAKGRSLERDLREAQSNSRHAKKSLRKTMERKERELTKRQKNYDQLIDRLKARKERSYQDEQKEITNELEKHQRQHFHEGMSNALISKASISGVGPKLEAAPGFPRNYPGLGCSAGKSNSHTRVR